MHRRRGTLLILPALLLAATAATAQTSYPMISHTYPVALQRGKTTDIVVDGKMNFFGAYKVLFEGAGLQAEILPQTAPAAAPPAKPTVSSVKLKVTVAPDAALGVHEFRIATSLGLSSIGQLVIVDDPVILEKPANNTFEQAQEITLPCVVAGKIEALEDVDNFKFEAQAGQTFTFELFCARLQDKIHDLQKHAKPMISLFDSDGRELAANDTFFFADPLLTYTVTRAGSYIVQIRESTYDGDPRWVYALIATNRPQISHVYPMAGNPGAKIDVEPIGSTRLVKERVSFTVPDKLGIQLIQLDVDGTKTNPATFIVSALPQVLEKEPNDDPAQATRIVIPAGINGRIGKKRDMDHFVFAAKKGVLLRFELKARRFGTLLNSSLHGVLDILNAKGTVVATNDVTHGQEASLLFTPTADGDYTLRVRDLNSKGGDTAVYYVEADFAKPDFTVRCDPDKAMIGPGSSTAWYVHVARQNGFTGPVTISVKDLPKDVTASPLTIPPAMTQGMIVVSAAPKAQHEAANVQVIGTATVKGPDGKEVSLTRGVTPNEEIYSPGGGRAKFDVNLQSVAVTDPSDVLKVEVSTTKIVLKPGQEVKIDVTIQRRGDYDKGLFLDILHQHLGSIFGNPLPPGVTIVPGKSKTSLGTGSKGFITLKADAAAAPIDDVPICVLAHVSINFVVKVSYASPVITVSVSKN